MAERRPPISGLFDQPIQVINVGVPSFSDDLKRQGVPVRHVDWRPPAGGNKRIQALLRRIKNGEKTS